MFKKMSYLKIKDVFVVSLILAVNLYSGDLFSFVPVTLRQYSGNVYSGDDGLPQNTVQSIVQCKDGYMWFGTQEGLSRFNGRSFENYNRWNLSELKDNSVTALYCDGGNSLWVGTYMAGIVVKRGDL